VSDVLKSHGGLQPAEATLIVETLLRVRNEVSEPAR
jgi:hypothetical protein